MHESGLCIKYPFEEATNVTRYSWFERSNLVAYEPGMRRRVAPKGSLWPPIGTSASCKGFPNSTESCNLSPRPGVSQRDEVSSARDTLSEDMGSLEDEVDGECDGAGKSAATHLPVVVVEHRWSSLFLRTPRKKSLDSVDDKEDFCKKSDTNSIINTLYSSGNAKDREKLSGEKTKTFAGKDSDSSTSPQVVSVQEALTSPEFGGRSSVLRCLIMDMEMRFISRTQMNYAFHLSAIAERVVHHGVYYLNNPSCNWTPVISNEPIDVRCALDVLNVLKNPVAQAAKDTEDDTRAEHCQDDETDNTIEEPSSDNKHSGSEPNDGDRPLKYQKVTDSPDAESGLPVTEASDDSDVVFKVEDGKVTSRVMSPKLTRHDSANTSRYRTLPDKPNVSMLQKIYVALTSQHPVELDDGSDDPISPGTNGKDDVREQLFALVKKLVHAECPDALIYGAIAAILHKNTDANAVEERLTPFDPVNLDAESDTTDGQRSYCDGTETVDRFCLCRSKYVVCPTVFNEYIIFGGTPATPHDMEFGIWIFDTPFKRLKMRDVPVIYHQQVQYSTKKYIASADLNDAVLSTRVLNLRLEFCGRGDWIFDDGSLPCNEADRDRQMYGKVVTAEDLMQLEFMGTVNQISKKFFLLQKAFLTTGKEGTSRLIFMDPYANIDATICDDKDYADHLVDLLTVLYKHSPETFLSSCNGYYYHEDGFLPESTDIQRVRNTLFHLETSHYRTAMLADVVAEQKHLLGLSHKMPFLTKCKRVIIGKSRIHGYGLFAVDTINKGELIMEYAGVVISDHMADIRETAYERLLCGSIYMFRLDLNHIIDSTFYGNCARFINHSCDPNTATTNFSYIDEEGFGTHVGIYASKIIPAGEEIYYNYRLSAGSANREVCRCGSYMCTGYMSLVK
ncbi:putative histone-lysine N-methyltransferase set-2 [Babesia sp. Xinjiang]|uniref:putative histone-lysine N-methyltransferase set-2 n=1 Tax=Babesia sp. Xinjiang TaxID=462227 RepID=UPI000A262537|nr:putative histone-lysine N-methyltransferase set-2 [Babesia sp. Xinjiang]ORM41962.1 putative histone-lysine N-methyltransferase set-2 [Babesia sp. Xinjiang]